MRSLALAHAARARLAGDERDRGFALLYVLAVTTLVAMLVGTTLIVTTGAIVPSVQTAYSQAADAAAQSGLQDFVTRVDRWCGDPSTASVSTCTLQTNIVGPVDIKISNSDGSYRASYRWIAAKDPSNRYFRVKATGTVKEGLVTSSKIVFGDVVPGNSLDDLNFGVVTGFETQSSSTVLADWPDRYIALDAAAQDAADVPINGNGIHWSGSSPGTAAGKVAVCNATFDAKGGRADNPPPDSPNPYVDYTESGLDGNNYSNYQPCHTSWGNKTELLAPADQNGVEPGGYYSIDSLLLSNSFPGGTGPLFNQPVQTGWQYTTDDANVCGTAEAQNYRSFSLICPGMTYNVEVGGSPNPASKYPDIQYKEEGPQVPDTVNYDVVSADQACTYIGPTRVVLKGDGTAVITSPQTTNLWAATSPNPGKCYVGAGVQGMAAQTVDITGIRMLRAQDNGSEPQTTPAIAHGSSGWPITGQRQGDKPSTSNSVFYVSNSPATSPDAASATAADDCSSTSTFTGASASPNCQWSDASNNTQGAGFVADGTGWTKYSSGSTCTTDPTDHMTFNCEYNNGTFSTGIYTSFRTTIKNLLSSSSVSVTGSRNVTVNGNSYNCPNQKLTPTTASADQFACMLQDRLAQANSGGQEAGWSNPSPGQHRYIVTGGSTATTTKTANVGTAPTAPAGFAGDPLFTTSDGTVSTETVTTKTTTFTVGRQTYGCYASTGLTSSCSDGLSPTWGDGVSKSLASTPQFQVTITQRTYSNFVQGASGVASFPSTSDVTQYQMGFDNTGSGNTDTYGQNGPGDIYVEGSADHTMALVADDDLVITGATGPVGTNPATPNTTTDNRDPDCGTGTGRTCPVTPALELVGRNNARIYHPVKCANAFNVSASTFQSEIAATTPGFCPNDITGLYTSLLPANARPNAQYANMRPDLAGLTVHAALFALGNAPSHITCPQPPDGGGVCGGEFTVDNFSRGASLGYVTEIGALGMAHHSPVGEEWEIADTTGATSRLYSGYQMAQQYQDLKAMLHGASLDRLLGTSTPVATLWHIVSVSTGAS